MQYLKKDVTDEVDFLHAGKRESLLQIDTRILMRQEWSSIPKVPKITSLQCLYNTAKKENKDEVDLLQADKHQSLLQVDFSTLGVNFS